MASATTLSANESVKDLILVHTVQLKLMIKAHFSGKMVSSGISDAVNTSVHSDKTPSEEVDDDNYYNRKTIY